jgi:hypothetical protein
MLMIWHPKRRPLTGLEPKACDYRQLRSAVPSNSGLTQTYWRNHQWCWRWSRTQPRRVGRQPGPQPFQTCIKGVACTATSGANGVAFAVPVPVPITATPTAPIIASIANFILLLR